MNKRFFIALMTVLYAGNITANWLDFFRGWSELNARNRRELFGLKDTSSSVPNANYNAPAKPEDKPQVTLADLKNCIPQAIYDFRDYILDKDAFIKAGARPPHGILLVGPPGTGKTSIVRALAAEVNVPLIATSASKFVEIYVGTGPKFIRDLIAQALDEKVKWNASHVIIFIDEIDCIGSRKNRFASPEDHKTLNELLNQMDGYASNHSITFIAATNCLENLDEALLRPGRFDEIITIELPDYQARLEILKLYVYGPQFKRSVHKDVSLESIAQYTQGWSGAELESIINKAALLLARDKRTMITQADLDQAYAQVKKMHAKRS
jgi:cell division protease FtsH